MKNVKNLEALASQEVGSSGRSKYITITTAEKTAVVDRDAISCIEITNSPLEVKFVLNNGQWLNYVVDSLDDVSW